MDARTSLLLLVDIQERLAPVLPDIDWITANSVTLLTAAERLAVPVLATEHCADKIGPTITAVRERIADGLVVHKTYFSAHAEPEIAARLASLHRPQVIVVGIEAHVCVLQTTLDLQGSGYTCHLVEDATGSRSAPDKQAAVSRMRDQGVQIVTTEMVLFEWLQRGDSAAFKDLFPMLRDR
ncbi:MAG: isochorismatase family protein [Gammaproteobacteria bacterium]|nr:isochorismatase family protein [Gammaproteobacteria bacterium]